MCQKYLAFIGIDNKIAVRHFITYIVKHFMFRCNSSLFQLTTHFVDPIHPIKKSKDRELGEPQLQSGGLRVCLIYASHHQRTIRMRRTTQMR